MSPELERYSRQVLFPPIGEAGQRRLLQSRVLLCGCGALGSAIADGLVRAGVGFVRLVDRDFVELSNLQRQTLFDEQDIADQIPKAVAAARKLRRINSSSKVEPVVADIDHTNILRFAERVDLLVDGLDNFETRFLINDASLASGIPWIYGGCIGSHGQTMTIIPGETACLRCLMESVPPPGTTETCDTAGIIGPAVTVVAALQVTSALKLLSGQRANVDPSLMVIDVWDGTLRKMNVAGLRDQSNCAACVRGERDWLTGQQRAQTSVLCGRNAVQVSPPQPITMSLSELASKLRPLGRVATNVFLIRLLPFDADFEMTIFADGRAIIKGTNDPAVARSIYARYVGN
jgi:adenylyltransferase/sulfurtransferase